MATSHPNTPLDIIIRNTCANVAILLTKTHNLQVEVSQLRAEQAKLSANYDKLRLGLQAFLNDPTARKEAEATLKEFGVSNDSHVIDKPNRNL